MSSSDNEPSGESHRPPRPLAAARNAALNRVDPLQESVPPPGEQNLPRSNSTAAGGEASGRVVTRGDVSSTPADLEETGCDSGGGLCLARVAVMSTRGGEAGGGGDEDDGEQKQLLKLVSHRLQN